MLRLRINYSGFVQGFSILHFDSQGGLTTAAQDAADAVSGFLTAIRVDITTAQVMQVDPEVLIVNEATNQVTGVESVTSSPISGSEATEVLPQLAMALVRWRTGTFVNGREIRGRTFIPGYCVDGSDAGELTPTLVAGLTSNAQALIADADSILQVYSPTKFQAADVTSASVWGEWASMRSRRE